MSFFTKRKDRESASIPSDDPGTKSSWRVSRGQLLSTDMDPTGGIAKAMSHHLEIVGGSSVMSSEDNKNSIPEGHLSKRLPVSPTLAERKKIWDSTTEGYIRHKEDEGMDPVRVFEWAIFAKFLARIGVADKTILDLGTGNGLLMRLLNEDVNNPEFQKYTRVYGLDISYKMLHEGLKYFGAQALSLDPERVMMIQASMSDQIMPIESCDIITAVNSLDGVPDNEVETTFASSFRVLRNHGHLAILIRHPKRHGYYASQGQERKREIGKYEEGAYKERWPGASEGVIAYYRGFETWNNIFGQKHWYINKKGEMVTGYFDIVAFESTKLTTEEAYKFPELAKRYFHPHTGEQRSAGVVVILEKVIEESLKPNK